MSGANKNVKLSPRLRRKIKIRKRIFGTDERPRLCVFRSEKHIYAQIISDVTGKVLAAASTKDKDVLGEISKVDAEGIHSKSKSTKSITAAKAVGLVVGKKLQAGSITKVVFDRNGFLYHGRIKAVADGARASGLHF